MVTPALGTAWYHCVNTRLLLEFCEEGGAIRKVTRTQTDMLTTHSHTYIFIRIHANILYAQSNVHASFNSMCQDSEMSGFTIGIGLSISDQSSSKALD